MDLYAVHMVASFIIARAKLSAPINGVFVAFNSVASAIRRFCTPAFFHHGNESVFDMSKAGSALLFRYRGRNFALLSRHQLGHGLAEVRPEQFTVTLIEPNGTKIGLSPNTVSEVKFDEEEHTNLQDLLLLEYENTRGKRNLRGLFLDLDLAHTLETVPSASVQAIFSIGYPTAFGDINTKCDDEGIVTTMSMELRWVKLYLMVSEAAPLDPENRRPMVQDPKADQETIDPDGMSGAPVFFVWLNAASEAQLGFAGMITHARDRRFMIHDGAHLRRVVDAYIDKEF
jgi:hypothetical protein